MYEFYAARNDSKTTRIDSKCVLFRLIWIDFINEVWKLGRQMGTDEIFL